MYTSNRKQYVCIIILLIISAGISFFRYDRNNLFHDGPLQLLLIEYEDSSRYEEWNKIIETEKDPLLTELFGKKEQAMQNPSWNMYRNLPAHFLYKVFHLRGAKLWLAYRVYISCLGICAILLIFLIGSLFYGQLAGLIAGILTAFSPHLYIHFNTIDPTMRGHNILLSLLVVYLFLLSIRNKSRYFAIFTGIFMGVNFILFFHIGSFMIPAVIFIYCLYRSCFEKDKPFYLIHFFRILFIGIISGIALDCFRSIYFHLPSSVLIGFFKGYFALGSSHTMRGIVLFNLKTLILNIQTFIQGLFINGKTLGGHYSISPPGIPLIYNYLISLFFAAGCFIAVRDRKHEDLFFFLWFMAFFIVYALFLLMSLKNISIWIIPAIFILAARSVDFVGSYLQNKITYFSESGLICILSLILIISSILAGSFWIFSYLPKKNFYHGVSSMGSYPVYQYIAERGYSERTKLIFPTFDTYEINMMLRLFTERVPNFVCLTPNFSMAPHFAGSHPPEKEKWMAIEPALKEDSDKIFYIFRHFRILPDNVEYKTDEDYRIVFEKIHPDTVPFIIKAPAGQVLWRIYEIN